VQPVVGLRNAGAVEGVGLDDVRARVQVLGVNVSHHVRPGEHQHIVVAPEIVPMRGKALAAKIRFSEAAALDHGAHGAVNYQDAFLQR
jgi:hypothetical protein